MTSSPNWEHRSLRPTRRTIVRNVGNGYGAAIGGEVLVNFNNA